MEKLLESLRDDDQAARRLAHVLADAVETQSRGCGSVVTPQDGPGASSVVRPRESRRDFGSCDVSGAARARVAGGSSPAPCWRHSASLNVTSTKRPKRSRDLLGLCAYESDTVGSASECESDCSQSKTYSNSDVDESAHYSSSSQSSSASSSSADSESSDQDSVACHQIGRSKRAKRSHSHPPPVERSVFDPSVLPDATGVRVAPEVADYLGKHVRHRLEFDAHKRLVAQCPRPSNVPSVATPRRDDFVGKRRDTGKQSRAPDPDRFLWTVQDEVLDTVGPLCALYSRALSAEQTGTALSPADVIMSVQQTLVLVGHASEHISQERRYKLLRQHEPAAVSVLRSADLSVSGSNLFGPEFLKLMRSQAKEVKAFQELSSSLNRRKRPFRNSRSSSSHPVRSSSAPASASAKSLFREAPGPSRNYYRGTDRYRGSGHGAGTTPRHFRQQSQTHHQPQRQQRLGRGSG